MKFIIALIFLQIAVFINAETVNLTATYNEAKIDSTFIDSLLANAIKSNADSMDMARLYQTKAQSFLSRNLTDSAEIMALKSRSYMKPGHQNNDYLLEKDNIDLLRKIYEITGDYKQVINYNNLWDQKTEEIKANEVKRLELQFAAEMKESELKQLNAESLYQEKRFRMVILTCVLLCIAIVFLMIYLQYKKRNLNSQIALIAAEREETKLKVKLKEEQTVKMQLEKYMTLSDFRLKELELIGKTKDLEQLYSDKNELDKQVELFRQKVEAFELSIEAGDKEGNDILNIIKEDLRRLFSKRKIVNNTFLQNLEKLNMAFISAINEQCAGKMSVPYLKYCVCFAIGMGSNDVSEYFNIELTSVYMIRYRLKKKFRLHNDDDLSQFLQEQIQ